MSERNDLSPFTLSAKRLRESIGRILRKEMSPSNGPHWRPSANALLAITQSHKLSVTTRTSLQDRGSRLLDLPKEIRHLIEAHLLSVDAVCLRETCQMLRYESKQHLIVQDLNGRQLYSFRRRLDRDSLSALCKLDGSGQLSSQLAICSFCSTVHEKKKFTSQQLRLPPEQRICTAASKRYLILGDYWAYPSILRRALEEVLATGRDDIPTHHWMPAENKNTSTPQQQQDSIVLSRAIENNTRCPERRSTLLIDNSGLVFEHHFHLQSHSTMLPIPWDTSAALAHPQTGMMAICPHHTVCSAGARLGRLEEVANRYVACCIEPTCETVYGWFECQSELLGCEDLCFRVLRRFGWVENVADSSFWQGQ